MEDGKAQVTVSLRFEDYAPGTTREWSDEAATPGEAVVGILREFLLQEVGSFKDPTIRIETVTYDGMTRSEIVTTEHVEVPVAVE